MSVLRGVDLPADLGVRSDQIWTHLDHEMSVPGGRSASRSSGRSATIWTHLDCEMSVPGGRSAKFEIILTTRCQYWRVDLSADLGVDLPNLNSSWPQDVSTGWVDLPADLGVDLPNLKSSWPQDVSTRGVDLPADLGIDLPNLNSSWPQDVSTRRW